MDSAGEGVSPSISLSEDGAYAAQLSGKDLMVHLNPTSSEFKDVQMVKVKENAPKFMKFSRKESSPSAEDSVEGEENTPGRRLLHASDTRILVWQLPSLELQAEIESVEPGSLNVDFGGDENEVIVFHAWNTKISVFGLDTGRSQVIKSPKFSHHNGFGYRPRTREFAVLLKPDATDILTIHGFRSYEVVGRATLPTIDAQGLKWSPDGRWIGIWDAASCGTKLLIYTADGQLFRAYTGPPDADPSFDLGIRNIEWSPVSSRGASEYLAVGKVDGTVDLLNTKTFTCSTTLSHGAQIEQHSPRIWYERHVGDGSLEYTEASSSSAYGMIPEPSGPPRGVSFMAFSSDGKLMSTVDQTRSNIAWIWELENNTAGLVSALVHEHPVRQLAWHPSQTRLLIVTAHIAAAVVRHWCPSSQPLVVRVPASRSENGKYEVKWLPPDGEDRLKVWFGTPEDYVFGVLSEGDSSFTRLNWIASRGSE